MATKSEEQKEWEKMNMELDKASVAFLKINDPYPATIEKFFEQQGLDPDKWIHYNEAQQNFSITTVVRNTSPDVVSVHTYNYVQVVDRKKNDDGSMTDVGTKWTLTFNKDTPSFYLQPNNDEYSFKSANNQTLVIKRNISKDTTKEDWRVIGVYRPRDDLRAGQSIKIDIDQSGKSLKAQQQLLCPQLKYPQPTMGVNINETQWKD